MLSHLLEGNPHCYRDFNPWTSVSEKNCAVKSLAPGRHIARYKEKWVFVVLSRERYHETLYDRVSIYALTTNRAFFDGILQESR